MLQRSVCMRTALHHVALLNATNNLAAAASSSAAASFTPRAFAAASSSSSSLLSSSSFLSCTSFARSISTNDTGDRHKGMRAKRQDAADNADEIGTAPPSPAELAAQREAKKAAREAKKSKQKDSAADAKKAETEAKRLKKEAEREASMRAEQKFKANIIEKEVPLMDVTGIKPGQNRFTNILELMKEEKFPNDVVADMEQIGDYATGSTKQILSGRIVNLVEKFGRKPYDCGSPEVQIAILTERLKGYDRHMIEHNKDINSRRGFLAVWHNRRKLLKYLRRTKYETYAYVMKELNLREADIDSVGLDRTSGTQVARIKRD